jgi:hypothetical protein
MQCFGSGFNQVRWTRIRIQSDQWIRIRVWILNSEPGSGFRRAKMTHKNRKKVRNSRFWSAGCSLLRAEGFSCSLDVLYGGLEISKLKFLIKKVSNFFSQLSILFNFWSSKLWTQIGSGSGLVLSLKCWIRISNPVLRIRDILVRIRILGSAPLTNISGCGSGCGSGHPLWWLRDRKLKFLIKKISNFFLSCQFYSISGHQNSGSKLDPDPVRY